MKETMVEARRRQSAAYVNKQLPVHKLAKLHAYSFVKPKHPKGQLTRCSGGFPPLIQQKKGGGLEEM